MRAEEFIDSGLLQEANRQFFHPLGLALGVYEGSDTARGFVIEVIEDPDPVGFFFGGLDDPEQLEEMINKAKNVQSMSKHRERIDKYDMNVQLLSKEGIVND